MKQGSEDPLSTCATTACILRVERGSANLVQRAKQRGRRRRPMRLGNMFTHTRPLVLDSHAPPLLPLNPLLDDRTLHLFRILREVERIPALRRLSDSALRVTSATPSDGRLAALALYRLGSAARAAESAPSSGLASTAASAVEGSVAADGQRAAVGPSKTGGAGEGGGGGGERPESGVADAGGAAGDAEKPAAATESREQSSAEPTATLSAETGRRGGEPFNNEQAQTDGATTGTGIEAPEVKGYAPEEPGAASESVKTKDAALAGSVPGSSEGGGGAEEVGAPAAAAAVGSPPTKGTTTAAAFDMEEVRSDQRFEQLVEIIECVAKDLSVSDTSKARMAPKGGYTAVCLECSVSFSLRFLGVI